MPLTSPKVTVEFDGEVNDLVADSKRVIKELDEIKRHTKDMSDTAKRSHDAMQAASNKYKISITDFKSAYGIALDVLRVGQQVWSGTVGELVKYGDQVQKLKTITGQSGEDVS